MAIKKETLEIIKNHLNPRVYINYKIKQTILVGNYLGPPKLSQVQQISKLFRTYDYH